MATFHTPDGQSVPAVTAAEMRRVDEVAVDEVGLALLSMMENAGRTLAGVVRQMRAAGEDRPVLVLAGDGGNGGGGLCGARHLANHGVPVEVALDRDADELTGAAARQFGLLDAMDVPLVVPSAVRERVERTSHVVDALVGYGLQGAPRGRVADLVETTAEAERVVSLDVPTGVDATTGERPGAAVDPDRTLTLALPKTGLGDVGPVTVVDIGIPAAVFERAGIEYRSPFARQDRYWLDLTVEA